ncbi:MAG: Lrp/AsnC family transcriptional regulator [Archaeoglobus sp.]|nr:MAG: Lrp/AsnC family transcriptional regulator [Archaeoglobus sp.]
MIDSSKSSSKFDSQTVRLLMDIQYRLPLTTTPLSELAERANIKEDFVINRLRELHKTGVIKRYGANLNYRAFSKQQRAALVAAKVDESRIEEVARIINSYRPKHNYWRDASYNVWFTIKAEDFEAVERLAAKIMEDCCVKDYIVLPTKRVYKMDVKYDLIRGTSWSENTDAKFDVPKVEEIGIDRELLIKLERLEFTKRPFLSFKKYGYSEEELVSLISELTKIGVVRDFSGVLKERKIGFRENGMNLIKTDKPEKLARKLVSRAEITHLVERVVPEEWNYPVYFMVHAVNRESIEKVRKEIANMNEVEEIKVLYSIKDLMEI